MDSQLSDDASRSSEPITKSPAQEGILPDLEHGLVLEPEASSDKVARDEPASGSTVQAHILPDHKDGPELESNVTNQDIPRGEPTSRWPTQEHLFPRTQGEAQQPSVSMGAHQVVSDGDRQAAVPFSRIPATDLLNAPQVDRWSLRPEYTWIGLLPHPNESQRWENSTVVGRRRRLLRGPTRPLGPPLKPFDGPRVEDVAQNQWDGVMVENEMHQAMERARKL